MTCLTLLKSTTLVKMPSFRRGLARSFNLFRKTDAYTYSNTADEADARALKTDWENVGYDIYNALKKYGRR